MEAILVQVWLDRLDELGAIFGRRYHVGHDVLRPIIVMGEMPASNADPSMQRVCLEVGEALDALGLVRIAKLKLERCPIDESKSPDQMSQPVGLRSVCQLLRIDLVTLAQRNVPMVNVLMRFELESKDCDIPALVVTNLASMSSSARAFATVRRLWLRAGAIVRLTPGTAAGVVTATYATGRATEVQAALAGGSSA